MSDFQYDKEDEEDVLPFEGIDQASALQACRVFNEVPLNIPKCLSAMTSMLYLLSTGTCLTEAEATDLFFSSTKLLQSSHPKLRRLHYILMKELSPLVEQSFIASNSLMIDIKGNNDSFKANAIRTLYAVMDSSMYTSMDRTIMECMNLSNSTVVMAALVTGLHMSSANPDMPRKWATQLAEVMKVRGKTQYPAVALLHRLRRSDRLSVERVVSTIKRNQLRSQLAICLVIRMCAVPLREDCKASADLFEFIRTSLDDHSLVVCESAAALSSFATLPKEAVVQLVNACTNYCLRSPDSVQRFAFVRLLNKLSISHPAAVQPAISELERLVLDHNRTIATLAILAILRTGTEEAIERLITELGAEGSMRDFGDDLKMVIVDAMRLLNVKYPKKHMVFLSFLSRVQSEDDSSTLKQNAVETMIDMAKSNSESTESVLTHLAEFIDDCEFPHITKRVLVYLGEEAANCANPKKYVRYVYNHATLDSAEIRAVSITTLAKIAARVPALRRSIVALLRRSCHDSDDEVRDRALLYSRLFLMQDEEMVTTFIENIAVAVATQRLAKSMEKDSSTMPSAGRGTFERCVLRGTTSAEETAAPGLSPAMLHGRDELRKIQQLRKLGEPMKTSEPLSLTERGNEFGVSVLKHMYPEHIVLQFRVTNTMTDVAFRDVTIVTDPSELEAEPLYAIPVGTIEGGGSAYAYVVLSYTASQFPSGSVDCSFKFSMQEEETDEPTDAEEYPIESFDVGICDFIVPAETMAPAMKVAWDEAADAETRGNFALPTIPNLSTAVQEIVRFFGMYVEGGAPEQVTSTSHTLMMAGRVVSEDQSLILVQARVVIATDHTVALQLALRGGDADLRDYLINALLS